MAQTWPLLKQPDPGAAVMASAALLSQLVYRSRAVNPLSVGDLHRLTAAAQLRNRTESITGLVLYHDDCFYQWLEGPADALDRIMRSIRNDPRHTDIDVLRHGPAGARRFTGWDLKLATAPGAAAWPLDVMQAPSEIIGGLQDHPTRAPALLERLVAGPVRGHLRDEMDWSVQSLQRRTAGVLKSIILETVMPQLARQNGIKGPGGSPLLINPRAAELADLLIAKDQAAAVELISELQAGSPSTLPLFASLFEPAARALGDLWSEDHCSEFDVTLGLGRIQIAVRMLNPLSLRHAALGPTAPTVLIAPEPGEIHRLAATLDSEALWDAGWTPHCEFPADDKSLQTLLAATWFDVLDLSLSSAFRREHRLGRLTETIAGARRASRNASLLVVVGGRIFGESGTAGAQVGADLASGTSLQVERLIAQGLDDARVEDARINAAVKL